MRYSSRATAHGCFPQWQEGVTFNRIRARLQMRLDELGKIDRELFCVDATDVRASRASVEAQKKGYERRNS